MRQPCVVPTGSQGPLAEPVGREAKRALGVELGGPTFLVECMTDAVVRLLRIGMIGEATATCRPLLSRYGAICEEEEHETDV